MNLKTVTIGIPAFNEEANIKLLLTDLLQQKTTGYVLKRIIVISDGSTDNTVSEVVSVKTDRVSVIDLAKRQGKAQALQTLLKKVATDVLVLLDADVVIKDKKMIGHLIKPILDNKADLTSARVNEQRPVSFTQKMLAVSMQIKKDIFEKYNEGNNIYTCHGRAYALSKKLYTTLMFDKKIVAEDAYAYLFTTFNGYRYMFATDANVYYKLPLSIADHQKQSIRFIQSYKQLTKMFGESFMKQQTFLPRTIIFPILATYSMRHPLLVFSYAATLLTMRVQSLFINELKVTWSIAESSKRLKGVLAV